LEMSEYRCSAMFRVFKMIDEFMSIGASRVRMNSSTEDGTKGRSVGAVATYNAVSALVTDIDIYQIEIALSEAERPRVTPSEADSLLSSVFW
jgi:hypothetical protein